MENTMRVYDGKVYGIKVSPYGLANGYLDYLALSKILDGCILNNTIRTETSDDYWEMVAGDFSEDDTIYQTYIISEQGYEFLAEFTDEIVLYNERLDLYLWGVTHFGTGWDYVLTNIKLVNADK